MTDVGEDVALKRWTIDKRVPLALILAMSIQTCGIVRRASGLTMCVEQFGKNPILGSKRH